MTLGDFLSDLAGDVGAVLSAGLPVYFSSPALRFHDSISSSSMGVMPRLTKGRRPCLTRKQAKAVATTRKRATAERTVLRVMTSVRFWDAGPSVETMLGGGLGRLVVEGAGAPGVVSLGVEVPPGVVAGVLGFLSVVTGGSSLMLPLELLVYGSELCSAGGGVGKEKISLVTSVGVGMDRVSLVSSVGVGEKRVSLVSGRRLGEGEGGGPPKTYIRRRGARECVRRAGAPGR